jgi:F-type H+-transporting ATPase subunit a
MKSPLIQFEKVPLSFFENFEFIVFSNSNLVVILIMGFQLIFLLESFNYVEKLKLYSLTLFFVEEIFFKLNELLEAMLGEQNRKLFNVFLTTLLGLAFFNLEGVIPYVFTMTSQISNTLGNSFPLFFGIIILAFIKHGVNFFAILVPKGAPLILAPLLVVIEFLSMSFRVISLGVRLFANIMAGHTLLKVIVLFSNIVSQASSMVLKGLNISIGAIVLCLYVMETGIGVLQSYVWTVLTGYYLTDSIKLH